MLRTAQAERLRRRPLGRYRYVRLRWRLLFAAIDAVGTAVFALVSIVRSTASRRNVPPEGGTTNRILLVQLDHLGDAVLSTVMLGPLRRRFPTASIEVLASESNREVFQSAAEVDRVYVSQINRFARGTMAPARRLCWILATLWWGLWLRFGRRKIDLAIDVRGDFPVAVILWLSGARRRLGWESGGGGFLLTDRAEFIHGRPEVDSRLALLALLGIEPDGGDALWRPVFRPSESARAAASGVFAPASPWLPGEFRIVAHVGAGTPAKRWPAEHWRELIARLVELHAANVVLVGSPDDEAVARSIAGTGRTPSVRDWTGRLTVDQLAAVIEAADVFVGADSGPAHLAAAVGTPAVVLFSGTNDPRQWKPCGAAVRVFKHPVSCSPCHRSRCPMADHPCMRGLVPHQVAEAVLELCRRAAVAYPEEMRR